MTKQQAKQLTLYLLGSKQRNLTTMLEMLTVAAEPYIYQPVTPDTVRSMALSLSSAISSFAPDGVPVDDPPDYVVAEIDLADANRMTFHAKPGAPDWVLEVIRKFNA